MERMICQCCGEALHKHGDVYECGYCGATYRDDQAEKAADLLRGLLDDFKLEQLSNARRRLYETTHEKYPSSQAVTQAAGNVLSVSPDDFMARVYLHSHDADPHELISLLSRGNVSEWEAKETVDWLVRSLDFRAVGAVKDFADRHLKGAGKTEALNRIEDEAFKLDSGVYDLSLKRDVFLCYSTEDMPRVIEIMETFEENALSCFAAFRNLRHGKGAQENYQDAIFRAMRNCRVFVFLSSNSSRNPHRKGVAEELDHLVSDLKDKPRVEFLLEDYPERMPILAKRRLEEAFPHLEYCREADDLIVRVSGLLNAEENAERDRVRKIAEEAANQAREAAKAEFEAIQAERAKQQKELEEERRRLEKEKLEIEKRRIEAEKGSSALPPVGGAMDAESANKKKAEAVEKTIDAIGNVEYSPKCKARIDAARKAYDALTKEQRAFVHNADVLLAAKREYGEAEEAADKKGAEPTIDAIEAIGKVELTPECRERIATANAAYSGLTKGQRAHVHNAEILQRASQEYTKLEDKAAKPIEAIFKMKVLPHGKASVMECRDKKITEAAIPESYRGNAVTSIGDWAFSGCYSLKSIVIPSGVTTIGEFAFCDCYTLASIDIPESVTKIGNAAFRSCFALAKNLGIGVDSIATISVAELRKRLKTFAEARNKENASKVGKAIEAIGTVECSTQWMSRVDEAQSLYTALSQEEKALVPNHATLVSARAEYEKLKAEAKERERLKKEEDDAAKPIEAIFDMKILPDGNASVARCRDKEITEAAIPERYRGRAVTSIGEGAFSDCKSLSSITIPASVTSIGEGTFRDCSSLSSIVLPDNITSIGSHAFINCSSLKSIVIPDGVTSIGEWAFAACQLLTSIVIPDGVTVLGDWAFCCCSSLSSIVIPKGVTKIGIHAFEECSSLSSITIPASVTSIGGWAFRGCSCEIHFEHKKPLFGYPEGFSKDCLEGFKGKAFWGGK